MTFKNRPLLLLFLTLLACTTGKDDSLQEPMFRSIDPAESNISFSNDLEFTEEWNIIDYLYYYNGAGVAAGDVNKDGLTDLIFTSNQGNNTLYINKGDLSFEDRTKAAGIRSGSWSTGVTMADVNGDGWLDIYICQVGNYKVQNGRNQLYINQRDGTFREEAAKYSLDFSGLSTQAAFFDYDNDGDLDMYLLNHSVHSVNTYGPASIRTQKDSVSGDRLYENLLDEGQEAFRDVTEHSGIYSSQIGYGLGVRIIDYNHDGWQDIYISNDFHENDYLYKNQGDGTFVERGEEAFGHTSRYSMGNDAGDLNNDGWEEIISVDMLPGDPKIIRQSVAEDRNDVRDIKASYGYGPQTVRNVLQYNWGNEYFSDIGTYAGIHATDWSWAPLAGDLDNDGWKDIYITNGIARRPNDLDYIQYYANTTRMGTFPEDIELIGLMPELRIPNFAYRNRGDNTFEDVTRLWGLDIPSYSHGVVEADLDNDGDLDIAVNNVNGTAFLFENRVQDMEDRHFLTIRLDAGQANRFGIGSRVEVYRDGSVLSADIANSRGFMSAAPPEAHLGLGTSHQLDSLVIYWPGGGRQVIPGIPADTVLSFSRSSVGQTSIKTDAPSEAVEIHDLGELGQFVIEENSEFRDYKVETLIPYNLSSEGPGVAVGDVNADGRDDIFVGGAHGIAPSMWIQGPAGEFTRRNDAIWLEEARFEDVDARFFDAENDGDLDLVVISGGNQFEEGDFNLRDRLYLNDGTGKFTRAKELPHDALNGSVVVVEDFNGDGYDDLFIGSRSVPGSYGIAPQNVLLINNGDASFRSGDISLQGMVSAAQSGDMDGDGDPDLVVAGDWMEVTILENQGGRFEAHTIEGTSGWWRSLLIDDMNGDGMPDIIAGNLGLNHTLNASQEQPLTLLLSDFDGNGQTDPVIFYYRNGAEIPFPSKDQLDAQIPAMKKEYVTYRNYAEARNVKELMRSKSRKEVEEFRVETFEHMVFINKGDFRFEGTRLPDAAQWTCINDLVMETSENGERRIMAAGNSLAGNTSLGPIDALSLMRLSEKDGNWRVESGVSGAGLHDVVQRLEIIRTPDGPLVLAFREQKTPVVAR